MNVLGRNTMQDIKGNFYVEGVNYNASNVGNSGDVLHLNGDNRVYWDADDGKNFNQSLNTGDNVEFNGILIPGVGDGGKGYAVKGSSGYTYKFEGFGNILPQAAITRHFNGLQQGTHMTFQPSGNLTTITSLYIPNSVDIGPIGDIYTLPAQRPTTVGQIITSGPFSNSTTYWTVPPDPSLKVNKAGDTMSGELIAPTGTFNILNYPLSANAGITIKNIIDGPQNYILFESYTGAILDGILAIANNLIISSKDFLCATKITTKNLSMGTGFLTQYTFPETVGTNGQILKLNGSALEFKDNILPAVVRGSWYVKDRVPTTFFPLAAINTWYYLESSAGFNELHVQGLTQAILPVNQHRITNTSGATILAKIDANFSLIIQSGPSQEVEWGIGIDAITPTIYMGGRVDDTVTNYPTEMSMSAIVSIPNNSYLRFAMRTLNNASQVNIYYASFTITTIL